MILYGFLALIVLATAFTLTDWRSGLFWYVVIGLLQDPVRKLVPGTPGYLVLATTPVLLAAIAVMLLRSNGRQRIAADYSSLERASKLFFVSLLPAAVISATYGAGSWKLTILGAFTWGSLVYSVLLGYRFARDTRAIRRFIGFYCVATSVLLAGTLLDYLKLPFPALGTEMFGMEWIRQIEGATVYMVAGFFRSPDVMGWHAAAVAMLGLTMAIATRGGGRWLWLGIAVWGTAMAILCGRRKMVYMIPLFVIIVGIVYLLTARRLRILPLVAVVLMALGGVVIVYKQLQPDDSFMDYYTRDPGDVYAQVERHGVDALSVTISQFGIFGAGLGMASTGAHHVDAARPNIWQESGPSRVLVELGVPGFLCFTYLGIATLRSLVLLFRNRIDNGSPDFALWVGLLGMIVANGASFVVSGQIFGDPFITCLLAAVIGTLLSASRLRRRVGATRALRQSVPRVEAVA